MQKNIQNKLQKFLLLLFISLLSFKGYSQSNATEGTEFFLSFTKNYTYVASSPEVACQIRYVVTETCNITTQYGDGTYLDNNVQYTPGIYTKEVDKSKCYNEVAGISSNNIKITSTKNIGVFAINLALATTDATAVLPTAALGNHYTMISNTGSSLGPGIYIIAPNNSTKVTIKNTAGAAVLSNISLNAGQAYLYLENKDLTGYTIESNYNVAVFSTVGCGTYVTAGGCDHYFEQIWPTENAGKNFLLWNMSPRYSNTNTKDRITILALEDATEILKKVGNTTTTISLNKYATNSFFLDTTVHVNNSVAPVQLIANKPIIVSQILGYAPALKWISPVEQRITKAAISPFVPIGSSVIERHQLHVMIPAESKSEMVVKETRLGVTQNVALDFYTNLSDPNYLIATRDYAKADNVLIEMANPGGLIAYMAGFGNAETYHVSAGTGAFNLQNYFTVTTKTQPYNDTYYSATSDATHTYEETDNITVKRTIEKSFSTIRWYINGTLYNGVVENSNVSNTFSFPASLLKKGENIITMSVRYSGTAEDVTYIGKIWLTNVSNYPDNVIEEANCFTAPPITNWQPGLNKVSNTTVHSLAQLFVGDIDGDNLSEVVTTNHAPIATPAYKLSDSILIFDSELNIKNKFRVPSGKYMHTNSTTPIVLLKLKESDSHSLIVTAAGDAVGNNSRLIAYKPDGSIVWTSTVDIFNSTSTRKDGSVSLVAGDINNDGVPEILAGDRIFNAETGVLIATLPNGYGRGARTLNGADPDGMANYTYMPALADIDNDGKLEVVAGNVTYKINIVDRTDASKNSVEVLAQAKGGTRDGFVSIADINLDGKDDIVVVSTDGAKPILTVWDGTTGEILAGPKSPSVSGRGGSRAFIGNVDDDIYPEIFFSYVNQLVGFDYNPNAANVADKLLQKWITPTSDGSGATTLSMFDFDQNDRAELVYRDETDLRIVDGMTGTNKKTIPCHSATHSEYPIIVDFDRDGHADILVSGAADVASRSNDVRIYRFSGVDNDWAPARTVWNQHGYNSVHVNEDLTIPKTQFKISTLFPGRDGVFGTADDVRPFNGYLLQQTFLSKNGVPYYLTPNAKIVDNDQIGYDYDSDSGVLNINNLKISNVGDALLQSPVKITVYKGEALPANKIFTYDYQSTVAINETKTVSFDIPNFKNFLPISSDLVIRLNDAGTGFNDQLVCDSCCIDNETNSFVGLDFDKLAWADSYRKCVGDNVLFNTLDFVGDSLRYKWMLPNTTNIFSTIRQPSISNLDLDDAGRYVFVAENINNNLTVKYTLPYLSVAPPLMSWRQDAVDHNWNNLNNWRDGVGNLIQAIPAGCTDVHIPGGALRYPSLDTINSPITMYGSPVSKDITFHYGGQIAFPHRLDYKKAFVQYNWRYYESFIGVTPNQQPSKNIDGATAPYLKRGQWYMLSAPLKKMASGDFALAGYPLTWQALINREEGLFEKVNFSSPFATNDIDLSTKNNAIAVKVAPYNTNMGYVNHRDLEGLKGIIEVPYFENDAKAEFYPGHMYDPLSKISTFFYFNNKTLQQIASPVGRIKRGQEAYRFIFEKEDNTVSTVTVKGKTVPGYKLNVSTHSGSSASDSEGRATIMIGNPYMSSINTKRFFDANEGNINLFESAGYKVFDVATQTWVSMPYSVTNYIQPLQAFVVTIQDAVTELVFPLEGDYAVTEAGPVISSGTFVAQGESLFVKASVADQSSISNYAILSSDNQLTDIKKTIHSDGHAAPEAFFVSPNGRDYNLVQLYHKGMKEIKLGVKSSNIDKVLALNFENVSEFALYNNVYPILVDNLLNIQQPLLDNPIYRFNQQSVNSASEYAETDRFTLLLNRSNEGGGIEQAESINVTYGQKYLKVFSNNDLAQIEVYSVLGQKVHHSGTLSANTRSYEKYLPLVNGVYIVKVTTTDGKSVIKKVIAL